MGCWFSKSAADAKPPPYDFQRAGPLRYLGYAGHIGTACGSLLPCSATHIPQMVTTAYILGDVYYRTANSSEKGDKPHRVAINAFDAIIWQLLASVFIPGLVFSGLKTATKPLFASKSKGCARPASFAARFVPCALAILATPLMVTPIDKGVDFLMNNTYRALTKPTDEELKDPRTLAKEAAMAKKEAEAKANKAKKEAEERAKKAEKELADKAKREEKERLEKERKERELERKKCEEEAKAAKAKIAEEEKVLKEKLKREEQEFKEKQAQMQKEFKDKGAKMECK